jgi:phosphomannomutase/phosphoglucomutase
MEFDMGIYKDCDIRGIYGEELTAKESREIGMAAGTLIEGRSVVVSGDIRNSTPELKDALVQGLKETGARVFDVGMNPTPVFYYAKKILNAYAGVQVTASHNPPKYNGFKLAFGSMPVQSSDILKIESLVRNRAFEFRKGSVRTIDGIWDKYEKDVSLLSGYMRGKVVVDAGNGAVSELMPRIFRNKGMDVVPLFCEYDGRFPNRDPNPAVYSHLAALQEKVRESGADFGVAFDGDGDRVVFADDLGRIAMSERSFVVFIREYLKDRPGKVVYDLKSSSIVKNAVKELGGEPLMERSGHAFIKRTLLEQGAVLGGEISGHFFFGELGYDDGMYAALKMAEILTKKGKKFSEILGEIPKSVITPDIRISVPYEKQDGILEKLRSLKSRYALSEMDGVRLELPFGWMLVRKSVTEQAMTVRIEAEDQEGVDEIKEILTENAKEFEGNLD